MTSKHSFSLHVSLIPTPTTHTGWRDPEKTTDSHSYTQMFYLEKDMSERRYEPTTSALLQKVCFTRTITSLTLKENVCLIVNKKYKKITHRCPVLNSPCFHWMCNCKAANLLCSAHSDKNPTVNLPVYFQQQGSIQDGKSYFSEPWHQQAVHFVWFKILYDHL